MWTSVARLIIIKSRRSSKLSTLLFTRPLPHSKTIFAIIGSASEDSANQKLVETFGKLLPPDFQLTICPPIKTFPHFDPELSTENPPEAIIKLRKAISTADGILISSPEYVFSIPSGLKNVLEWCVATTVFTNKPVGLITASAHGQKGHEELQLILKTIGATFTGDTTLLIQGVKGKVAASGQFKDEKTKAAFEAFAASFIALVGKTAATE